MAKFNYKMQNILNIKMRLETQAKTEFSQAAAKAAAEEETMRKLILRKREYEKRLKEISADRLDVDELRKGNDAVNVMMELMKQQALALRIAQRNLEKAREKLNETMQERKIHEKLKEKAFEEFKLELNEEEKKEIDQLVSFNYNNNDEEDK